MRRKSNLSLDLFGDRLNLTPPTDEEDGEYRRMLWALKRAMDGELTARQKECIRLRYLEGKGVYESAAQLGISAPTVSKHLKKARGRLEKVMRYSFPRLN
ncbi:RNA polymerase sigma factor [Caproiciproducens sp. LBM24188]|nr:sigma-70 family RNA polymerase sigma factor [Oscillospiraceae bacterium]HHV30988.1 sigma-70 family RNA polymerase sigma factor [Clostridiales bacterium]